MRNGSVVLADTTTLTGWRKPSYSGPNSDNCVEVASVSGMGVAVRNNRDLSAPGLLFDTGEWGAFVAAVKDGEYDDTI